VLFKFVDGGQKFVSNISVRSTGTHSLDFEISSSVVVSSVVPFSGFRIDSLCRVVIIGELGEFLKCVFVEKVSISLELGGGGFNLSEVNVVLS